MAEHIDWNLEKENQEKKVIARSARKKVTHTGCKLPSDFITDKEKQQLNGEVITMDMNKPVAYKAFKLWPADLQKEYLEKLVKEFGVGVIDVGNMMGVSWRSWHQFLTSRHLRDIFPVSVTYTKTDKTSWELFCKGEWKGYPQKTRSHPLQNTPESHENALGATNSTEEGTDTREEFEANKTVFDLLNERINKQISEPVNIEKCCCDKVQLTSMSLVMKNVKSWDDIFDLIRNYPLPEHNSISIVMADEEE